MGVVAVCGGGGLYGLIGGVITASIFFPTGGALGAIAYAKFGHCCQCTKWHAVEDPAISTKPL